jgi:hypothetical protein
MPDITEARMCVHLAVAVQTGHCFQEQPAKYWATVGQIYLPFCSYMMKWERDIYMSYGSYTSQTPVMKLSRWQKLWWTTENVKLIWHSEQGIFIILQPFQTSGNRHDHCRIRRKHNCQTMYSQETQTFGTEIHKLCNSTGHTYNMEVYGGEDQQLMAEHFSTSHSTVI